MELKLTIKTGNAAMLDAEEVARVLKEVADEISQGYTGGGIADYNGNTVGSYTYDSED